eukprot:7856839-Pyramimonas_sp.AAC.1
MCIRHCGQLSSFRAPNVAPLLGLRLGAADQKIPTNPLRSPAHESGRGKGRRDTHSDTKRATR